MQNVISNKKTFLENLLPLAAALCIPIVFNAIKFPFGISICMFIMLYVISASGLDILFGYSGQMSMGHAGFYAIGAYGSTLLAIHTGIPVYITILVASVAAALVAALLAYPASTLKFHFLALATTAFGNIVFQFVYQSPGGITGNAVGIRVPKLTMFGVTFNLNNLNATYFLLLFLTVLMLIAKSNIVNSRVGRAFVAIRENSHAADGMGINVRKYKIIAFSCSAFFVAFAGSMFAHISGWASPDGFSAKQSVLFVTVLLFGGTASKWGPIIGAILITILQEYLRQFANVSVLIYGILLLFVIVLMPGGIYGFALDMINKIRKKGGK